jgi:hypothetical protein
MSNRFSQYLYSVVRQAAQELKLFAQFLSQALSKTPLPRVLAIFLAILLLLSLIPLILSLFIVIVILRVLLGLLNGKARTWQSDKQVRNILDQ